MNEIKCRRCESMISSNECPYCGTLQKEIIVEKTKKAPRKKISIKWFLITGGILSIGIVFLLAVNLISRINLYSNRGNQGSSSLTTNTSNGSSNSGIVSSLAGNLPKADNDDEQTNDGFNEDVVVSTEAESKAKSEYLIIVRDCTWEEAYADCRERGGHLLTLDSEEEYQEIIDLVESQNYEERKRFYLGGKREPYSYDYRWINASGNYYGEPLNKSHNWKYSGTPEPSFVDSSTGDEEMYMEMFYYSKEERWVWNDDINDVLSSAKSWTGRIGYICEFD